MNSARGRSGTRAKACSVAQVRRRSWAGFSRAGTPAAVHVIRISRLNSFSNVYRVRNGSAKADAEMISLAEVLEAGRKDGGK